MTYTQFNPTFKRDLFFVKNTILNDNLNVEFFFFCGYVITLDVPLKQVAVFRKGGEGERGRDRGRRPRGDGLLYYSRHRKRNTEKERRTPTMQQN